MDIKKDQRRDKKKNDEEGNMQRDKGTKKTRGILRKEEENRGEKWRGKEG